MNARLKAIGVAALVSASLVAVVPAASAAPMSYTCVITNNVIYRDAPEGKALGQVHRGQGIDVIRSGGPDLTWANGNLWGGRQNVWIYWELLGTCA
jgi:hypothetical protein